MIKHIKGDCIAIAKEKGSDRAGGNWNFIEELIEETWQDIDVTVCSL